MAHPNIPGNHRPLQHSDTNSSNPQPSNQEKESNMYTDMSVLGARDTTNATAQLIRAMIYRGKNACDQCPESIAELFKCTFPKVNITYAGPDEDVPIDADTLSQVDVFAQPGGPDVDEAMDEAKPYASAIRNFVSNGGRYVGFCLGGYMAGHDPGYSLIPAGDDVSDEIDEPGAQVTNDDDTIIQVDWTFSTSKKAGKTEKKRWVYFQDGPVFTLGDDSPAKVLARYSSNGDVAAVLNQFGKGWVANVGPHPEANQDWYDDEDLTNPEGVKFDIGQDFLRAAMQAGR